MQNLNSGVYMIDFHRFESNSLPSYPPLELKEASPFLFRERTELYPKTTPTLSPLENDSSRLRGQTSQINATLTKTLSAVSSFYIRAALQIKKMAIIFFESIKTYFQMLNTKINPEISEWEEKERIVSKTLKKKKKFINKMQRENEKQRRKIAEDEEKTREIYLTLYSSSLACELMDTYGEYNRGTSDLFSLIQNKIIEFQRENQLLELKTEKFKNKNIKIHEEKEVILSEKYALESLLHKNQLEMEKIKNRDFTNREKIKSLQRTIETKNQEISLWKTDAQEKEKKWQKERKAHQTSKSKIKSIEEELNQTRQSRERNSCLNFLKNQ